MWYTAVAQRMMIRALGLAMQILSSLLGQKTSITRIYNALGAVKDNDRDVGLPVSMMEKTVKNKIRCLLWKLVQWHVRRLRRGGELTWSDDRSGDFKD